MSDVLGDVVCGGFSIPARAGNADAILIVTSGEFMSLFAANNILRGLRNINPGRSVLGLVFNRRGDKGEEASIRRFADAVGLPIVCDLPRSKLFADAEAEGEVLASLHPDSEEASRLRELVSFIQSDPERFEPSPLSEGAMTDLAAGRPIRKDGGESKRRKCTFDGFDAERNLSYLGDFVMPACTSHGAVDAAMKVRDAAVILHGPRNCAYLMEYAFVRRTVYGTSERSDPIPDPGLYSTNLDADGAFRDTGELIESAVLRAKRDGYRTMFLIPTCSSEIMGTDLADTASSLSSRHSVEIIPVPADDTFLGSKFGGTSGFLDAMIARMDPREVEKGTVNLIARWFYGLGKDDNMESLQSILSRLGLRVRFRFMDFCTMSEASDFCRAEYDIQLGYSRFNEQTALVDDLLDELRERLCLICVTLCNVGDNAGIKVDINLVACVDILCGSVAFKDRQTDVDGVAVEYSREGGSDNACNTALLDSDGSVLTGASAAEVEVSHHDVAGLHLVDEILVDVLHAVGSKLLVVCGVEVTRRDYYVRIYIIAILMYYAVCFHVSPPYSCTSEIYPVSALAAAIAGLARYTSEVTSPILPTKFLFVVETALSPGARIPI